MKSCSLLIFKKLSPFGLVQTVSNEEVSVSGLATESKVGENNVAILLPFEITGDLVFDLRKDKKEGCSTKLLSTGVWDSSEFLLLSKAE